MDQFDIYANIERPLGKPGKRKTLEKCSENIYQNEDHTLEPIKSEAELSGKKKQTCQTVHTRMLTVGSCACMHDLMSLWWRERRKTLPPEVSPRLYLRVNLIVHIVGNSLCYFGILFLEVCEAKKLYLI